MSETDFRLLPERIKRCVRDHKALIVQSAAVLNGPHCLTEGWGGEFAGKQARSSGRLGRQTSGSHPVLAETLH